LTALPIRMGLGLVAVYCLMSMRTILRLLDCQKKSYQLDFDFFFSFEIIVL